MKISSFLCLSFENSPTQMALSPHHFSPNFKSLKVPDFFFCAQPNNDNIQSDWQNRRNLVGFWIVVFAVCYPGAWEWKSGGGGRFKQFLQNQRTERRSIVLCINEARENGLAESGLGKCWRFVGNDLFWVAETLGQGFER